MKITNHLNADGFRVQNLGDAVDPQDAVSKAQLDAAVQGWKWKEPVRAASTANITLWVFDQADTEQHCKLSARSNVSAG